MTADYSPDRPVELLPQGLAHLEERAAKRAELVHGRHEFHRRISQGLQSMATWMEAQTGTLHGNAIRLISGVSLVISLSAACSPSIGTESPKPEPTKRPLATLSAPYALVDTPTPTLEPRSTGVVSNPYLIVKTPTPTSTGPTPTETATATLKPFPICSLETYRDCPLTTEDLLSGSYLRWLNTLSTPFDASKVKLAKPQRYEFSTWYNKDVTSGDPGEAFYRKGVTYGYYVSPEEHDAIVLPVETFSPLTPDQNHWVMGIMFLSDFTLPLLHEWADTPPAYRNYYIPEFMNKLVTPFNETYKKYPDMPYRIDKYAETGDFTYLSGPGIILSATVVRFSPP